MWGYLTEFWNQLASSTVTAGQYGVDWFQNVGNSVAGAIGNLFGWFLHYVNDFFVFIGWVGEILKQVVYTFFLPVNWFITFFKSLSTTAFATVSSDIEFFDFYSSSYSNFFSSIPYWSQIGTALGIALSVIALIFVLKIFASKN